MTRWSRVASGTGTPRGRRPVVLLLAWLLAWLLAIALVWPAEVGAQALGRVPESPDAPGTPSPDLVAFAQAFNATWNAHDVEAVLAFFAPDAVVQQPAASAGIDGGGSHATVRDVYGVAFDAWDDPPAERHGMVEWAADPTARRAWVQRLLRRNHRVAATDYRARGERVRWTFRAFADPYQTLPGVGPTDGTAQAVVRAGHIATLVTAPEPASVRQREEAVLAADAAGTARSVARATQAASAAPPPERPATQRPDRPAGRVAAGAEDATWPLLLVGLGVGASFLVIRRRHPTAARLASGRASLRVDQPPPPRAVVHQPEAAVDPLEPFSEGHSPP